MKFTEKKDILWALSIVGFMLAAGCVAMVFAFLNGMAFEVYFILGGVVAAACVPILLTGSELDWLEVAAVVAVCLLVFLLWPAWLISAAYCGVKDLRSAE